MTSSSVRGRGPLSLRELRERMTENTRQEPRQVGFGKACLLMGARLGDTHRKEFLWISLEAAEPLTHLNPIHAHPEARALKQSCFSSYVCLAWFGRLGRGGRVLFRESVGCLFAVGSWDHGGHREGACHLSSLLLCSLL